MIECGGPFSKIAFFIPNVDMNVNLQKSISSKYVVQSHNNTLIISLLL